MLKLSIVFVCPPFEYMNLASKSIFFFLKKYIYIDDKLKNL